MALNLALYTQTAQTISSTEYSLTNNTTSIQAKIDNGIMSLFLDVANMAAGDEYEIALQEKAVSGGTQRRIILADLVGAQADAIWISPPLHLGEGWDFTVKKIAGTDRAFSWTIRSAS